MTELLTAAQMRAIEAAAIASGEATGLELMERAGRGVVEAMLDWRPELATTPHRAVVLCGPGNNGGDGFVVARLLKQRGWEVEVFLYADEAKLPPDAAENCRRWREMGRLHLLRDLSAFIFQPDIIVDALFGAGLIRPLKRDIFVAIEDFWRQNDLWPDAALWVAIDAPSGLCMDSGRPLKRKDFIIGPADLTVTFHRPRIGHYSGIGPFWCGALRIADIGLETRVRKDDDAPIRLIETPNDLALFKYGDHKYEYGHALVLAGGVGKGGAARLAARAALRIGAGLVTVGPPPAALIENAARLDAIMLRAVADAEGLAEILEDERINAICIGPGLGVGARTRGLVTTALEAQRRTVLDADALTSFAENPEKLFAMTHYDCVLTPHMGEFARLFPDLSKKLSATALKGPAYSKVDATREAAARAGCIVLLKGSDTVIADPLDEVVSINSAHCERSAPWLATAGSGDVLSGMITGMLARRFRPIAAVEIAAWMHVECARKFGPGLIAEDIPEQLPGVFRDLDL